MTTPPPSRSIAADWPFAARFALLNAGLLLFGLAIAVQINAAVGLAPWDAFHQGLARLLHTDRYGQISIGVGILIQLTAWGVFKIKPGVGSVVNIVAIGLWLDFFRDRLPAHLPLLESWAMFVGGIGLAGLAIGTYVAADMGAGPRDSFALGLSRTTRLSIRQARSGTELTVVLAGWLLGAHIGLGTLVFAALIGPAMQIGLRVYGIRR